MENIDKKISALQIELLEFAQTLNFEESFEFSPSSLEKIQWDKIECQGLYLIEIKNDSKFNHFKEWADEFCLKWTDPLYIKKWVPNPKKKRLSKHSELKDWIPLYIGKSQKINARFYEHIYLRLEQPTTGLKLKARENMQNEVFRLSYINIPTQNYDWVMPVFENNLRNRINPILGRQ
ncbi:hypothetical protein [Flavobacterium sp.]|jgi:hypothetical protein|uniref:hypothetical protein n=1 Tax=Flavobacterium sp. TaxID=239 RepID=UPI002FDAD099